ncbi:MAG: methionyl-tRNA formyltransferase, partial [Oscillospiraceae bacterium]
APRTPQDHSAATYTRPLTRDDSPIDWDQSPRAIIKHICGLEPWPVATAQLGGQTFKIHAADYSDRTTRKAPGTIVAAGKDGVTVACADGQTVRITQLQAPGKKRMSAADYLLGHTLPVEG